MAIRELGKTIPDRQIDRLKEGIKEELRRPEKKAHRSGAPVIFRERTGVKKYSHYYVVWDKFKGLGQEIRSSIVYNSIKDELGQAEALKTTVAMGLTHSQAQEMGLI